LERIQRKFGEQKANGILDDGFTHLEDLPKRIEVAFIQDGRYLIVATELKTGEYLQLGDKINDNSDTRDFYRYHDVFHLSYMAILNWSPVMRALFKRKRKSDKKKDEIEDGARAGDLEEAITAFIFEYARKHDWLINHDEIDFEVLETIGHLTAHLEVNKRRYEEWEKAILTAFHLFEKLKSNKGGIIKVDRIEKKIDFVSKSEANPKLRELFQKYDEPKVSKKPRNNKAHKSSFPNVGPELQKTKDQRRKLGRRRRKQASGT
jgi:hypothetical protein